MFNSFFRPAKKTQLFPLPSVEGDILKKRYQELVNLQHINEDLVQLEMLDKLQNLLNTLSQTDVVNNSLYIFGDVGRGKSMLMELFFEACPTPQKRRVHFHNFMLEVHEFRHNWQKKQEGDPIIAFAKHLGKTTQVLCFDEFNVTDIVDAMILLRLFEYLFSQGLIFVATSNNHPDDLYKSGLQRNLFVPFITLLKQTADIVELAAKEDYRFTHFKALKQTFYLGMDAKANLFLEESFANLTNKATTESCSLYLQGREVIFKACHNDILYSSFEELCHRALGSADYIEIATLFKTVFIADIPQLSTENRDEARRFVTLIDALYEGNVKLICNAEVAVDSLYIADGVFEFKRTQSRLMEMQSTDYMLRRQSLKR